MDVAATNFCRFGCYQNSIRDSQSRIVGRSNVLRTGTPFYFGDMVPEMLAGNFPFDVR